MSLRRLANSEWGDIALTCRKLWNRDVRNRHRLSCGQQKGHSGMGAAVRSNLRGQKRRFRNHTSDLDHRVHFPHTIYVDEGPKGTTGFKVIRFCWSSARSAALSPCQGHVNGCGTLQGQWRSDPPNATAGSGRVPVLRVGLPSLAISDYVFLANVSGLRPPVISPRTVVNVRRRY
jgi:hypothetical protein